MTVLFADLVGYTALSERLDSEVVRELVSECLRRLVQQVDRYEGTVDKFLGDAVMALWGAPLAHEDDAARALRAALGMLRAVETFNTERAGRGGPPLALRIGIQAGEVVAGPRRVGELEVFSVNGDAVNVASRLQGATGAGTILVGAEAVRLAGSGFAYEWVEPLVLKNKAQPVAAARLVGLRTEAVGGAGAGTPLVGRAAELGALRSCLAELRRGRGQLGLVLGEPGLGKSRLLAELRQYADGADRPDDEAERGPRWFAAQAYAHEQGHSYGLTRSLLRALLALDPDEPEAHGAEQVAAMLERLGCSTRYPVLAHLLGLPLESAAAERLAALDPRELQRLVFDAVAALLAGLAAERPLVLELDDLHWADPTSVDLLLELLTLVERAPVLFLCAFRPERDAPAWALRERIGRDFPHRATEVVLRPLSEDASAELVVRLLRVERLPPGLRGLLERAAGTPLWVEELVRTLVERGLLVIENGQWRETADLSRVELPTSLQALIVARIDRLGEARPTLQTASVIGRRFGQRVLERIAADESLDEHLLRAQRVDLVRELAVVPEREYGFKHALTQEAAYSTLLVRRRRELHRQVAEALEALYAERLEELRPTLAHHYARAELWERALEHARQAGQAARARYANPEALAHFGEAIVAAERAGLEPTERLELHEARAGLYSLLGQFEPARQEYETALALAEQAGDEAARVRLLGGLGLLWGGHKDYQRGLALAEQAAAAAATLGDGRAQAETQLQVGLMQLNQGRLANARQALEQTVALFGQLGDERGQAQALDILGMCNLVAGDLSQVIRYSREAAERLERLGDRATAASSTLVVGLAFGFRGERAECEAWLGRGLAISREIGARGGEAFGRMAHAQALGPYGAYGPVLREASRGLEIAREVGHQEWTGACLAYLGWVHRECGDLAGARRLHAEMTPIFDQLGTALWSVLVLTQLGEDAARAGEAAEADRLLAEALEVGGEIGFFTSQARLARLELLCAGGDWPGVLAGSEQLRREASQFVLICADARRVQAEALAGLGQVDQAELLLREVQTAARSYRAEAPLWRASLALADLLKPLGRLEAARAARAEALAALESVAADLADPALLESFRRSEPFRRAEQD